jgi:hypothetical protein
MKPSEVLDILEAFPKEYGVVRDRYEGKDEKKFVLIFQDDPENWSVRWSIGKALHHLRWVKVVCRDGAWELIDTTLAYTIPDESIRRETALYFLRRLLIHPAEYANILRGDLYIDLCGVEEQDLYKRAQKLYKPSTMPGYLRLQVERAHSIVKNLLERMERLGEAFSVVTCCGDLPDLISEEFERLGISYAVIRPKMTHPSDRRRYKDLLSGKIPSYEEILEYKENGDEVPPEEEFRDKKMEEMKEQARIRLIEVIKSGDLLPRLERMIPPAGYKKVAHILSSTDYGPKTKAVLVKAELHSFIDQLQAKLTRRREIGLGLVGLIAAVVGALFDFGVTLWWYRTLIVVLFGTAVLNSFLIKRFVSALRWLLHILAFLCGFYLFGRWGMLVGVILAASIGFFLVQREHRTTRRRGKAVREIKEILTGKT